MAGWNQTFSSIAGIWKYVGDRKESMEFVAFALRVLRFLSPDVTGERLGRIEFERGIGGRGRALELTGGRIRGGEIRERAGGVRLQSCDIFKFADRVVVFLLSEPHVAQIVVGFGIARIDPNRRLIFVRRFVELSSKRERGAEVVVRDRRRRLQFQRRPEMS